MAIRQRLRRLLEDKSAVVEKASKIEKQALQIDPLGRIADLKEAGAEITIEVERIGSNGTGYQNKNFEMEEVEPVTFRELIGEHLGGGSYRIVFRKEDGHLLLRSDNGKPESHRLKVGGKPKGKIKAEKAEKKKEDAGIYQIIMEQQSKSTELVTTMLTTMITALMANQGNGKSDPIALIKAAKEIAGDGGIDPLQLVSGVMQLMKQYETQTRAPVQTTGSNSTGMEKFFESLGAAVPAIAPLIAGRLNPETPAALLANTSLPGTTPTPPPNSPESAGALGTLPSSAPSSTTTPEAPGVVAPLNPLDALTAPLGPVEGGASDPSFAAYGAIMKLRYVIAQRDDPYSIAAEMVDSINLILGAQRIAGRWQNFITDDNAGQVFDQYAPMIPEFAADPAFMGECRAALIQAVHEQLSPEPEDQALGQSLSKEEAEEDQALGQSLSKGEAEEDQALGQSLSKEEEKETEDEVHDPTDESQQASTGTEAADDRSDGDPGNHAREDGHGEIDG